MTLNVQGAGDIDPALGDNMSKALIHAEDPTDRRIGVVKQESTGGKRGGEQPADKATHIESAAKRDLHTEPDSRNQKKGVEQGLHEGNNGVLGELERADEDTVKQLLRTEVVAEIVGAEVRAELTALNRS